MPDEPKAVPVFFLKTKSTPVDGYEEYFSRKNNYIFSPKFVPVFEHLFNERSLKDLGLLISEGNFQTSGRYSSPQPRYGGIIFTSQRAIEAFNQVIETLRDKGAALDLLLPETVELFVVGPATGRSLRSCGLKCSIRGEESGNGENLASFILSNYGAETIKQSSSSRPRPPLLFLVGEQRRDIIPKTLQDPKRSVEEQVAVREIAVYETRVMESFATSIRGLVEVGLMNKDLQWVVIFSPTGCKAMLEAMDFLDASGMVDPSRKDNTNTFLATIGPTTRDSLRREFKTEPEVCAEHPTPESLGLGIIEFMEKRRRC